MPITCMVCGQECHYIQYRHLQRHDMTVAKYKVQFPDAPLSDDKFRQDHAAIFQRLWDDPNGVMRTMERTVSDETRARLSKNSKRLWADPNSGLRNRDKSVCHSPEFKEKMTAIVQSRWADPMDGVHNPDRGKKNWATRRARGKGGNPHKGKTYDEMYGKEASRLRQLRKDSGYWKGSLRNIQTPNKSEVQVQGILDRLFPGEFKFNGNYDLGVSLQGMIPDFVNVNGQKEVIEFFGTYFHTKPGLSWRRGELGRIMVYNSLGYRCLVIWTQELKDDEALTQRLLDFKKGRKKVKA